MTDQASSKRRPKRRWLRVLGIAFVLLIVFMAVLPTLVSWGPGQSFMRNAISRNINGTVEIDHLSLGWFSDQSIVGLAIIGPDGAEAAKLDLKLEAGLVRLITGPAHLNATISGTLSGEVRDDNSLSFQDLLKQKPGPARPDPKAPGKSGPLELPDLPGLTLNLAALDVNLTHKVNNQTLSIDDLTGTFVCPDPGQPITLALHGKTLADGAPGSIDITGQATKLFDSARVLSLRGASAKLDVALSAMPLPLALPGNEQRARVQTAVLSLASDDLTGKIVMSIDGTLQVGAYPASHVKLDASASNIFTADGTLKVDGAAAHVSASAENLPIDTPDVHALVGSPGTELEFAL